MLPTVSDPSPATRRRMRRTASRDNAFERKIRSDLFSSGLRYRVHFPIPGLPRRTCDIAFPSLKVAIFLDGCFWHGCPTHISKFKTNEAFWIAKIVQNAQRDLNTTEHLQSEGWTVLRFWEHDERHVVTAKITAAVKGVEGSRQL